MIVAVGSDAGPGPAALCHSALNRDRGRDEREAGLRSLRPVLRQLSGKIARLVHFVIIVDWIPDRRARAGRNSGSRSYKRGEQSAHIRLDSWAVPLDWR